MTSLILACLLACAASAKPPRAETAEQAVERVMSRVEKGVTSEEGKDARVVARTDKALEALGRPLAAYSWEAVAPLTARAQDLKRPAKVRLFATVFMGMLHDPAAAAPLTALLQNAEQDLDVRSAALQGLAAIDLPAEPVRKSLCATLSQPDLPRTLIDDILIPASRLGCADAAPLEAAARAYGLRPTGRDLDTVRRAAAALGRSRGEEPARALLRLLAYFPAGSGARGAVIAALPAKSPELTGLLAPESWPALRDAMRSETDQPASMLALIPLVAGFPQTAGPTLLPLTAHPDALVLASAAEALAKLRFAPALPSLEAVVAGALNDPRFSPQAGRPDPARTLARVEDAVSALRRVPAAPR